MNNKKLNLKNLINFNKYTFLLIFIFFLFGTGVTYAYLAYRIENDSVITGNVVAINVELNVELVVGTNEDMIPLKKEALGNALNSVGSTNGACVDSVGNLSCQVYKITVSNLGSRIKHVDGTIELYAKDGNGNVYNNLMWREITNPTTIKSDASFNPMEKSVLVSDLTMESKEVRVWYIAVWINEIDSDQLNLDKGDFEGVVTFESSGFVSKENVFVEEVMKPEAKSDNNIDFSKTSQTTNTNGVYVRSGTENDKYPIYYYRGTVDNNLIFAGFCWKVVRSTEKGGLKLIYNGLSNNGRCNNTGDDIIISNEAFNAKNDSLAYAGYMYGVPYNIEQTTLDTSDIYIFGNDVTYSNGSYTLTNPIDWGFVGILDLSDHHYSCFISNNKCNDSEVYYVFYQNNDTFYYITLENGKKIDDALSEMLDNNTNSSTIKGDKNTVGTLDYWYYTQIEQKGYSSYIEDTVWCYDRSIYSRGGFNPNGGRMLSELEFSSYNRITEASPSLNCNRDVDKFTVSKSNGNGDLNYPVGLLTGDEVMLAGLDNNSSGNYNYYLYTEVDFWINSPTKFNIYGVRGFNICFDNYFYNDRVNYSDSGVRPSISLKPGFTLTGNGNGSANNPYVVE